MDPFFSISGYGGHSRESKLPSYTASSNPRLGNMVNSQNPLAQSLAALSIEGQSSGSSLRSVGFERNEPMLNPSPSNDKYENYSSHETTTGLGTMDSSLFQGKNYSQAEDTSPTMGNGSPVETSTGSSPVPPLYQPLWVDQENVGGTTYYYSEESGLEGEDPGGLHVFPNFSVYSGPPAHLKEYSTRLASVGPPPNPVVHPNTFQNSYFLPDDLKMEIMHKNAVALSQANPQVFQDLPAQIDHYHELCPLEAQAQKSVTFGYPTTVYKAINSKNGFAYCLRRIHGFRLPTGKWLGLVEAWKQMSHCNLVQLREIFTTKAFGDSSLIFVYDYFPSSDTLMVRHFDRANQVNGYVDPFNTDPSVPRPYSHQKNALLRHHANMLPENLLWSYIVQLSSAIRSIHAAGLAVRSLDPTKILLTSRTRPTVRLNSCGIYDIVTFDPNTNSLSHSPFYQQEDLLAFGKMILALACNSLLAVQRDNMTTSLELISRTYSSDLRNLIMYLMNPRGTGNRSINDIMPMIGARFYNQLDSANARAELLENSLAKEVENGRLLRIIVKLSTVIERHDLNLDTTWSETSDRYILKLFRDYVFHQVTSDGRPWIDMSHVVYCLNRLDAGAMEKVMLMSRDEQSLLITTYAELKHYLEKSFEQILNSSPPMGGAKGSSGGSLPSPPTT